MFDKMKITNNNKMKFRKNTDNMFKLALIFIITTILLTNIQYVNSHRQCEHRYTKADEVSKYFCVFFIKNISF